MISIRIDPNHLDPTRILDIVDMLPGYDSPVTIRWTNQPEEIQAIAPFCHLPITLVVRDRAEMAHTAITLGIHLEYAKEDIDQMEQAINDPARWRQTVKSLGKAPAKHLLVALIDSSLRKGGGADSLRRALYPCLFRGAAIEDFDVFIRLAEMGIEHHGGTIQVAGQASR